MSLDKIIDDLVELSVEKIIDELTSQEEHQTVSINEISFDWVFR